MARQNTEGTSRKVKLTEALIKRAEPLPPQQPGEAPRKLLLLDTTTRGFACSVNAHSKSYVVIRRVDGKQVRYKFRRVNEVTLQEARTEAERLLVDMGSGVNPVEVKRAAVAAAAVKKARGITLAEAWALRQSMLKSKARSERTITTEKYLLEKYLADWIPRELASFRREDVRRKHAALTAEIARGRHKTDVWRRRKAGDGRATANNVMRSFRACWNRALRQNPDLGISPTANIDWHTITPRKAPIGLDGLATLWQRITAIESTARRDLWTLLLYTGLRKTSAIEIEWSDVNLDRGVLHIPKPKGGEARAFDLPLPTLLVDLFRARWAQHEKLFAEDKKTAPWVFAAPDSTSGHIVEVRAGRLGVSPHDMRRLFITCAESCDVSPYALKLLTNHALPRADVTAGYMSIDTERLRPVMETIAGRLTAHCRLAPPAVPAARVVPIVEPNIIPFARTKKRAVAR